MLLGSYSLYFYLLDGIINEYIKKIVIDYFNSNFNFIISVILELSIIILLLIVMNWIKSMNKKYKQKKDQIVYI